MSAITSASHVPRVLLVEDNPADQHLFKLAISASGVACEVAVANDGDLALADVGTDMHPDLIVLDWRLTRTDGGETLKRLTPVQLLTLPTFGPP